MNFIKSIFKRSPESITTTESTPTNVEESQIPTMEWNDADMLSNVNVDSKEDFRTPEKEEKPLLVSESGAKVMDGLENVPMKLELMNQFNLEIRLIKEIEPYIKTIFDGKLQLFNKNRAIVNEWVKKYLPQEWKEILAERDLYCRKRSGLPTNIKEIRARADDIMQKVKYRVDVIRDNIAWDKVQVGVSKVGGCSAEDEDESLDIPIEKMELRALTRPPVRFDPSPPPSTRPPSPPRRSGDIVVHRATAVILNLAEVVQEQQFAPPLPEDDEMSDISGLTIETVDAIPFFNN